MKTLPRPPKGVPMFPGRAALNAVVGSRKTINDYSKRTPLLSDDPLIETERQYGKKGTQVAG